MSTHGAEQYTGEVAVRCDVYQSDRRIPGISVNIFVVFYSRGELPTLDKALNIHRSSHPEKCSDSLYVCRYEKLDNQEG